MATLMRPDGQLQNVDSFADVLKYNYNIIHKQILGRSIRQDLATPNQIKYDNLKPDEVGTTAAAGHDIGGQVKTSQMLYSGIPTYLLIDLDFYMTCEVANTTYYTSEYAGYNFIKNITVTGGQNNATLANISGIMAGIIIPRAMFNLDVTAGNDRAGYARHSFPSSQGGTSTLRTTFPDASTPNGCHVALTWVVPLSRNAMMPFGSPLLNSQGQYQVSITWNTFFGGGGTASVDLRDHPAGYIKTGGGADTNVFTLTDADLNPGNNITLRAGFVGFTPPENERPGNTVADNMVLKAYETYALYGQLLNTIEEAPRNITGTNEPQELNGYHALSNLGCYMDYNPTIATSGVAYGPSAITGRPLREKYFHFTSQPWSLTAASGVNMSYVAMDARTLASRTFLEGGGFDFINGAVWLLKDNPGGSVSALVEPSNLIDYNDIARYTVNTAFTSLPPSSPRIHFFRQYYQPSKPVLQ